MKKGRKQKSFKCRHKIVSVAWIDADESSGWEKYKKESPWIINTIGYLVELPKKKNDYIVLANSHLPETESWSGLNRIPKGMVIEVKTLLTTAECGYSLMDDDSLNNT